MFVFKYKQLNRVFRKIMNNEETKKSSNFPSFFHEMNTESTDMLFLVPPGVCAFRRLVTFQCPLLYTHTTQQEFAFKMPASVRHKFAHCYRCSHMLFLGCAVNRFSGGITYLTLQPRTCGLPIIFVFFLGAAIDLPRRGLAAVQTFDWQVWQPSTSGALLRTRMLVIP